MRFFASVTQVTDVFAPPAIPQRRDVIARLHKEPWQSHKEEQYDSVIATVIFNKGIAAACLFEAPLSRLRASQ